MAGAARTRTRESDGGASLVRRRGGRRVEGTSTREQADRATGPPAVCMSWACESVSEALGRAGCREFKSSPVRTLFKRLARLSYLLGQFSAARAYAEDSLAMARVLEDRVGIANALDLLAGVAAATDPAEALKLFDEAIAVEREIGDKWRLACALVNRGETYRLLGDLDHAMALHIDALALGRETGDLQIVEYLALQPRGDRH